MVPSAGSARPQLKRGLMSSARISWAFWSMTGSRIQSRVCYSRAGMGPILDEVNPPLAGYITGLVRSRRLQLESWRVGCVCGMLYQRADQQLEIEPGKRLR